MNGLVQAAVQDACRELPAGRGLRILEVGAGTGGTTAGLLPLLPVRRSDYLFTDIGASFLHKAAERFASYPFVRYQPLDIEREPAAQGFQPYQADLVVAANVLHATPRPGPDTDTRAPAAAAGRTAGAAGSDRAPPLGGA
jgi:SAM-dependent methyltransferase